MSIVGSGCVGHNGFVNTTVPNRPSSCKCPDHPWPRGHACGGGVGHVCVALVPVLCLLAGQRRLFWWLDARSVQPLCALCVAFVGVTDTILCPAVVRRLFPFSRGLFEDKVSNLWCIGDIVFKFRRRFELQTLVRMR